MRLILVASLASIFLMPALISGQVSSQSHLREQPQQRADEQKIQEIMQRAETHYRLGELNLKEGKTKSAREEFDRAVDSVLEAGFNLRAEPGLQKYYLSLVERIYKLEVATRDKAPPQTQERKPAPPSVGFVEQKFEPSPLDELNKIVLSTDELEASAPKPCNTDGDVKLELRGFQVGMTVAEIKRRLPSLRPTQPDKYGTSGASVVLGLTEKRDPLLKDVRGVQLSFLDGRVSSVTVFYANTARWESADQFTAQVAEAMGIQSNWRRLRARSLDSLNIIECEGVAVVAGLAWVSGGRVPLVSLRDARALATIAGRVTDEETRKRKAEEERRRSFKP